jgi:hypothetical protein
MYRHVAGDGRRPRFLKSTERERAVELSRVGNDCRSGGM